MSRVWKTIEQRNEFFDRLRSLMDEYDLTNGFDDALEGEMDVNGILFDPNDPRMIDGVVVVIQVRNINGWESLVVLDPDQQSAYLTKGMLSAGQEAI